MKTVPEAPYLNDCLVYNRDDGTLFWKVRPECHFRTTKAWRMFNTKCAGKTATSRHIYPNGTGCYYVSLDGHRYKAHRLIMRILGRLVDNLEIDHIDGNGLNNADANLRVATSSQNKMNTRVRRDSGSGYKGVHYRATYVSSWYYEITKNGKRTRKAGFKTPEEAAHAREKVLSGIHGEFSKQHSR